MSRLQQLIDELREVVNPAGSNLIPFGGVSGAHSYPGPEPGKVGSFMSLTPISAPETKPPARPGMDRERIRRWRKRKGSRRNSKRRPTDES